MTFRNKEALQTIVATNMSKLGQPQIDSAIETYKTAFAEPPYEEAFTDNEAREALQYILDRDGDLVLGGIDDDVVALAGGYMKSSNVYYIEELAVGPRSQGQGIGRGVLRVLMNEALRREPAALEIRTTSRNDRAIGLYSSEGFAREPVTEVVAQTRQDGRLALDERVYLRKDINKENGMNMEKPVQLKRAAIMYPSGNTTAVVFDQMLDADREGLNASVMSAWKDKFPEQSEIEQCCFVTLPKDSSAIARVEMFGGEFCGNATRSVIQVITGGRNYQGTIEVSGVDKPLGFSVRDGSIAVEMPLPRSEKLATQVDEGVLVQLDGIAQLVVTNSDSQQTQAPRELLAKLLQENKYDLALQPAVGVTYYDEATKEAAFGVWVKAINTVFDETACGSGTCAIGVAAALAQKQTQKLEVVQPSGESIVTEAIFDNESGEVITSNIAGKVSTLYDGELSLS